MKTIETYKVALTSGKPITEEYQAIEALQNYLEWNGYDESDSEPQNLTIFFDEDDESEHFEKYIVHPSYGHEAENTGKFYEYDLTDSEVHIFDTEEEADAFVEKFKADQIKEMLADLEWTELPLKSEPYITINHGRANYPQTRKCTIEISSLTCNAYSLKFQGFGNADNISESHSITAIKIAYEKMIEFFALITENDRDALDHAAMENMDLQEIQSFLSCVNI